MSKTSINAVKGVVLKIPLTARDSSGALTNADSTPTVTSLLINGSSVDPTTHSATIANQTDTSSADVTGQYIISIATSAMTIGDNYIVNSQATIDSVTVHTTDTGRILDPNSGSVPTLE